MRLWLLLIGLFSTVSTRNSRIRRPYNPDRPWSTARGNPGIKVRISLQAANHIKDVLIDSINDEIEKLTIPKFQYESHDFDLTLKNLTFSNYKAPESSVVNFLPPRTIQLGVKNLNLRMSGNFSIRYLIFRANGTASGLVNGLTSTINMKARKNANGSLDLVVTKCYSTVEKSELDMKFHGAAALLLEEKKDGFENGFRGALPGVICKIMKRGLNEAAKSLFDQLGKSMPIRFVDEGNFEKPLPPHIKAVSEVQKNLILDTSMVQDVKVSYRFMQMGVKGEMRYSDSRRTTPFRPTPMNDEPMWSNQMLYVTGSDYIMNSMIYHAYTRNRLRMKLTTENLPSEYASVLKTSCRGGGRAIGGGLALLNDLCVGELLPSLKEEYPNSNTSVVLALHGLPDFTLRDTAAHLDAAARVVLFIDDYWTGLTPVMVAEGDMLARMPLRVVGNSMVSSFIMDQLNLKVHRSSLKTIDPGRIRSLSPVAKRLLGDELNKALEGGYPLPALAVFSIASPRLVTRAGFAQLGSEIQVDREQVQNQVRDAMRAAAQSLANNVEKPKYG